MMNFRHGAVVFFAALFVAMSGCELNVDDETRVARAEQAMASGEYRAAAIELKNV